ncbi:hypothetical protein B0A78_09125 [Flavobacterium columnare NBRC 100251 = ATCC 23463]|uniref:Outer membrane protein beta-barrel domain-containing protein n=2 Tax=Flavobacterium columnare TaxID=996 RepID=G8X643_FLACA|nr:DUF6048 family protein [Flavobacterium columnare]AEW86273.1 hypothetical protein FCOL_07270 [Flavobacterium columnare ATCC 49512]AMO19972.1 hypothetical protein UN65_06035 [Flavobacterium columnare]ANO48522.1 hypothetical protein Pf1_00274 [Flavobacterium columnare]APT23424.1 hypothetical protein BU993_12800 [Flavobacterium columnare]AUX17914.1 hypothetical protein AQ623_06155 [Flavobacterium columnare]
MKHISKFSFSLLLTVFALTISKAQEKTKDTIKKTERYGVRIGADLSKITRSVFDKNYKGLELVGDYRVGKRMYIATEIGNEKKTTEDKRLNFTTKGSYLKVGFDYNFYQNWLDMEDMVHLGLRYGFSSFNQELTSYKIYNTTGYFPQADAVVVNMNYKGLTAHWTEVVAGVKAKIFNNFYAGFSLRINYLLSEKKPENFNNLYIPGFNKTFDGKFGAGWNYSITYFIPLYKKKK